MSNNLPESQPSEEVDLGQLFKLIGKAFDRFFKFIGSILNKFFLAFVWIVFFIKRHFIKIAIAAVVGVAFGIIKQKTGNPVYKSSIVIKQNYTTGEHLYNTLDYYNSLINEGDSINISTILAIEPHEAINIINFEVESILNDNQKLKLFDNYTKSIDSALATTLEFKKFLNNSNDYEHQFQKITLRSKTKDNFDKIFTQIIKNITSSAFFENEQTKDLEELSRRESIIRESLKDSDTLQKVYQEVLLKSTEKVAGGTTSITFEGAEDKNVTKEFELYNSDLLLSRELVTIEREKEDLKFIIEIVSRQETSGTLDNKEELLGLEINKIIVYGIQLALLLVIILFFIEFLNYLDRFKSKI